MNRRCRQPSRHGRRCGGRSRPSGLRVVGTSAIFRCRSVALMTISEANSIPVVTRSILRNAAAEYPRRPQWKSLAGQRKNSRPIGRKDRVADVFVLPRHRAGLDPALEPVPHDEVVPFTELRDERHQVGEVVRVVRVAHDDVLAAGGEGGVVEGRPVPADGHVHDPRPAPPGDLLRPVGRAVVADHDLAADPVLGEKPLGLADARLQRPGLVQTRHHDGQLDPGRDRRGHGVGGNEVGGSRGHLDRCRPLKQPSRRRRVPGLWGLPR